MHTPDPHGGAGGRIEWRRVESLALQHNPLGDPFARRLPVYLPPGYDAGTERYPAAYVLAGYTGTGAMQLNETCWDENLLQRMDRLIASGRVRPMMLVLPDAMTRYGGSQYINSSATGNYFDYLVELVGYVDANFRTLAGREHRAVLGKSSGGYGATMAGMRRPDLFGLVADHSGDKYFELCYKPDFPKFLRACARFKDLAKILKNPAGVRPRPGDFFDFMNIAAMASCYSPNPQAPLGFDLPVDPATGELDAAVWERWLANDPVYLLDRHGDALRSLKLYYLDCGNRDEFNLHYGCRVFTKRLRALRIPHTYEEFDDGHRSISYRYDVSLEAIGKAMG
ncbi:MAG: esterase [Planctomycetota bacterium]|nr:esterase [Planctomycetota bacterium]